MVNSTVMSNFSIVPWKDLFWGNLVQNSLFQVKFATIKVSNMLDSMMLSIFLVLDQEYILYGEILSKKSKLYVLLNFGT